MNADRQAQLRQSVMRLAQDAATAQEYIAGMLEDPEWLSRQDPAGVAALRAELERSRWLPAFLGATHGRQKEAR
jgi:hypothetical protein